jgi:hypothetical protein
LDPSIVNQETDIHGRLLSSLDTKWAMNPRISD